MEKKKKKKGLVGGGTWSMVKRFISFFVGTLFNWKVGDFISGLAKDWSAQYVASGFDVAIYWTIFTGFIVYFGLYGIRKIKPFYNGVPVFLGQPLSWFIIPDGYFWLLPSPIMDILDVSMKLKDLDINVKEALSRDNVNIEIDAFAQARVTNPYKWSSVDKPDEALKTLIKQNLRIYTNLIHSTLMPGEKAEFAQYLREGKNIPVLDKDGKEVIDEETGKKKVIPIKAVSDTAEKWGYGNGVETLIVNDIRIPEGMTEANIMKEVETAQTESETTQHNLFLSLLGGGDSEKGMEAFLSMEPEERSKIIQAERNKRKVVTVDGNAGDFTKGGVAGATVKGGE